MDNKYFYQTPHAGSVPFDNTDTPFEAETVQEAIEESFNNLESRLQYPLVFGQTGNITDSYLHGFYNIPTNEVPLILPVDSELLYLTFSNENIIGTATVYIYTVDENVANQTLLQTFSINSRTYKSGLQTGLNILAGHGIEVRVESNSNPKPSTPIVVLYMRET